MKYTEQNPPPRCMLIKNACYVESSDMTVKGVLWHDTGCNNPNLKRYVQDKSNNDEKYVTKNIQDRLGTNGNGNDWNQWAPGNDGDKVCVHGFIGKMADGTVSTVQTLPWNKIPYGCFKGSNGSCNKGWIQFEICEDADKYNNFNFNESYFKEAFEEGCQLTAYLCKLYDLDPEGTTTCGSASNVPVILCHQDAYKLGLGSNHSDVYDWFNHFGKTMNDVRKRVKEILQGGGDWSKPATQVDIALAASGQSLVYTTYKVGVNLKTEEFVLPNDLNDFASTKTSELEDGNKLLESLYSDGKEFIISKTVPLVEKTTMELGGNGLKFFTESLAPFENLNYLNNTNNSTTWNTLNDMQMTSLDFNEIAKLKSGGYSGNTIFSNLLTSNQISNNSTPSGNNYLTFPMKYLNISQNYHGSRSHRPYSQGTPADYPIDICGKDGGRDWFYCPCDEIEIVRIIGPYATVNMIFFQSTSKVIFADGTFDYASILIMHPEDEEVKTLQKGKKYSRNEQIVREGMSGYPKYADGNHFHMQVASGKFNTSNCCKNNNNGKIVLDTTNKTLKPENAFFIDPDFTKISATGGLKFKNLPTSIK